jgi:hypothetical protein
MDDPAATLTADQLHRASGVAPQICQQVLTDLMRTGFLIATGRGRYARPLPDKARAASPVIRHGRA